MQSKRRKLISYRHDKGLRVLGVATGIDVLRRWALYRCVSASRGPWRVTPSPVEFCRRNWSDLRNNPINLGEGSLIIETETAPV